MSKLFIVYRTNRINGQAATIREAIQSDAQARGASVGSTASAASASTAMTASATTEASA